MATGRRPPNAASTDVRRQVAGRHDRGQRRGDERCCGDDQQIEPTDRNATVVGDDAVQLRHDEQAGAQPDDHSDRAGPRSLQCQIPAQHRRVGARRTQLADGHQLTATADRERRRHDDAEHGHHHDREHPAQEQGEVIDRRRRRVLDVHPLLG